MAAKRGKYRPKKARQGSGLTNIHQAKQLETIGMKPKPYKKKGRKKKARVIKRGKRAYLATK